MSEQASVGKDGEIIVECGLDASPDKVWRALSVPELAADWLGAAHEPAGNGSASTFEIVESVPFSRLTYRWRDRSASSSIESFVTVEIEARDDGATWFRLTHTPPRAEPRAANENRPVCLAA